MQKGMVEKFKQRMLCCREKWISNNIWKLICTFWLFPLSIGKRKQNPDYSRLEKIRNSEEESFVVL